MDGRRHQLHDGNVIGIIVLVAWPAWGSHQVSIEASKKYMDLYQPSVPVVDDCLQLAELERKAIAETVGLHRW